MSKRDLLGPAEHQVLWSVIRQHGSAYGVSIEEDIREHTGRQMSSGQIYATLNRLEKKGYVASELGDATPERGGRRKRHYRVTGAGTEAADRTASALSKLLTLELVPQGPV